ncbi:hypothetical protein [Streptomyces zaomyceticus]|uniref:hypothetical protein n=1 Tax=Streptomyces zaomyceticus TaxID=68286 RepID=UPI0036CD4394
MSVALSGSLARGDLRTTSDGTITSDLDLIPLVVRAADVLAARRQITPVLQAVTDRFAVDATAAITLLDAYRRVPCSAYVTSMTGEAFLTDPLQVGPAAPPVAQDPDECLPWLIQPITYDLAKACHEDPVTNLTKARSAALHLTSHLGPDDPPTPCRTPSGRCTSATTSPSCPPPPPTSTPPPPMAGSRPSATWCSWRTRASHSPTPR